MSAFPATIPVRLDADGRIDTDIECPRCGYNLRTRLPREGCPECGVPIDVIDRADADRLDHADPWWRGRIRRGGKLLHYGAWAAMPLVLPGLILATAGLWLLTTREPGKAEGWAARGTRLSARWASVGSLLAAVALGVSLIIVQQEWTVMGMMQRDEKWLDILFAAVGASMAVALLEAWRVLFKLTARADGPAVAQACRRTWKRYLLGIAVLIGLAIAVNVGDRLDLRFVSERFVTFAAASFLLTFGTLAWMWWQTVRLTSQIAKVLAAGRTIEA